MAIFISLQRTEPEYCNLTYFLHAADKPYPRLQESTVIVVNDDYTTASYIRSIFGRFAYFYMFENSLGYWRSARIAQLVNFRLPTMRSRVQSLAWSRVEV